MSTLKIKEILKEHKVTQREIANLLGVRDDSVSTAIKKESFSIKQLNLIAERLGVHVTDLFEKEPIMKCPKCGTEFKAKE